MIPFPEQVEGAEKAYALLQEFGIAYLAWQERTGKSLTAILVAEKSSFVKRVLIVTQKGEDNKTIKGWLETIAKYKPKKEYVVINYHSVDKVKGKFDFVILDEAHNYISAYPLTNTIWKKVHKIAYGLPILYASATPHAQGQQMMFHQFALSKWSPWKQYNNFYDWFKVYCERDKAGSLPTKRINNVQEVVDYTKVQRERISQEIKHLMLTRKRDFEHEPNDVLHYIELQPHIKDVYNRLIKERVLQFSVDDKDYLLDCDTTAKLRFSLHMLEGGTFKIDDEPVVLNNREKVDYILAKWGDSEDVVIMYNYIGEGIKLRKIFKHAKVLQATTSAEGIDLSMYRHLIIYSQDFRTAKHTQRRARQANKERKEPIDVHFLLVKKAVSEQVYKTVSINQVNFVDKLFKEEKL